MSRRGIAFLICPLLFVACATPVITDSPGDGMADDGSGGASSDTGGSGSGGSNTGGSGTGGSSSGGSSSGGASSGGSSSGGSSSGGSSSGGSSSGGSSSGGSSGTCPPEWTAMTIYCASSAGQAVSEAGMEYTCNYYTQGHQPSANNGAPSSGEEWTLVGPCP